MSLDDKPGTDAHEPDDAWLGMLEIALQVSPEPAHRPDPRSRRDRSRSTRAD
jgi:hypothetical protein